MFTEAVMAQYHGGNRFCAEQGKKKPFLTESFLTQIRFLKLPFPYIYNLEDSTWSKAQSREQILLYNLLCVRPIFS